MVLTVEILAEIFLGTITNWNDPRIKELNPSYILPNLTITPVGYDGLETSTFSLTRSFVENSEKFAKKFPEPFVRWPLGSKNLNPNLTLRPAAYGTYTTVQMTIGAIGYMPLPVFNIASSGSAPYALLKSNKVIYEADEESSILHLKGAERDQDSGIVKLSEQTNTTKGWPINTITYLILTEKVKRPEQPANVSIFIDCDSFDEIMRFFRWALIDKDAKTQCSYNGFFLPPEDIRKEVLDEFMSLTCEGEVTLDLEVVDDHDEIYFEVLLAFSMTCCFIFLLPGFLLLFAKDGEGNSPGIISIIYTVLLLLGALLVYLSLIFFYLTPDETWVNYHPSSFPFHSFFSLFSLSSL
jgi:ABC-type phosphate transport system substrate-binding protein